MKFPITKFAITIFVFGNFMMINFSDRKSTRLNSSHLVISYAVFCLKKKVNQYSEHQPRPGKHINGELTQVENIADIGGIQLSYPALQKALDKNPQASEPRIEWFTPE